jgi:hypothetical protein
MPPMPWPATVMMQILISTAEGLGSRGYAGSGSGARRPPV